MGSGCLGNKTLIQCKLTKCLIRIPQTVLLIVFGEKYGRPNWSWIRSSREQRWDNVKKRGGFPKSILKKRFWMITSGLLIMRFSLVNPKIFRRGRFQDENEVGVPIQSIAIEDTDKETEQHEKHKWTDRALRHQKHLAHPASVAGTVWNLETHCYQIANKFAVRFAYSSAVRWLLRTKIILQFPWVSIVPISHIPWTMRSNTISILRAFLCLNLNCRMKSLPFREIPLS